MDEKEKVKRRLSSGVALKNQNETENDDEAERVERRKSRVEIIPASKINPNVKSSWLRVFVQGVRKIVFSKESKSNQISKKDVWNVPVNDMLTSEVVGGNVDFRDVSLTIDATTHVYSRRVEDVHTKTNYLAGGLASENLEELNQQEDDAGKQEDDMEVFAGPEEQKEEASKPRRRVAKGLNTLETNPASLLAKKGDREYSIDPLFHKRSATFDSGGAKDSVEDTSAPVAHSNLVELEIQLRNLLQTSLIPNWQDLEICPEYAERRIGSSVAQQQALLEEVAEEAAAAENADAPDQAAGSSMPTNEFDINNDISNNGFDYANINTDTGYDHDDDDGYVPDAQPGGFALNFSQLDSHLQHIDQQEGNVENFDMNLASYAVSQGPQKEYTYFNPEKLQNWAGPQHWKYKSNRQALELAFAKESEEYQDEEGNIIKPAATKTKATRKAFRIDFTAPLPDNLEALLALSDNASILPKPTLDKQVKDAKMLLIPPDIHYNIKNFGALFLPHSVEIQRSGTSAPKQKTTDDNNINYDTGYDDNDGANHYDDADDDDGYGYIPDPINVGGSDFLQPISVPPRPGDETYLPNVAKVDKRVDVKALKNSIWRELCTVPAADSQSTPVVAPSMPEEKSFQDVLERVPENLSPEATREVSIPYCFVCLLHLANENHLALRQEDMDSLFVTQTAS